METIWGGPTKRFFVSMLTRDIELTDAILDLIDNCVDGATRKLKGKIQKAGAYKGFEARLTLSATSFEISDNCGGIPQDAIDDAFRLGRPKVDRDGKLPTIGVYGIGMKRAIFKMADEARVETVSDDAARAVTYTTEWLNPANDSWDLPIESVKKRTKRGVTISVPRLKAPIARQFGNAAFINDLRTKISEHFGYLIQKGFSIDVNGQKIEERTLHLYAADFTKKDAIRPFDFELEEGKVHIRVTVGFFRPLVHTEEIDQAAERSEGDQAGISVICNDRLVLLNDKSLKTGWGDGGVPKYHPQFRGIAGVIIFSSDHPESLPISTTKRDLDVGTDVYLKARQYAMEGLRECTGFTNKWKGMEDEATKHFENSKKKDVRTQVKLAAEHGVAVRGVSGARKHAPALPIPEQRNPMRRISFTRKEDEIKIVSKHLFGEAGQEPSVVGQECFDRTLKAARR